MTINIRERPKEKFGRVAIEHKKEPLLDEAI